MQSKFPELDRSGRFMVYFQAAGLCQALRLLVQTGKPPGPATVELVQALRLEARNLGQGSPFDRLPEVSEKSPVSDLLVAAEVIRTTMLACLSPEEIVAQHRSAEFGHDHE